MLTNLIKLFKLLSNFNKFKSIEPMTRAKKGTLISFTDWQKLQSK